MQEDGVHEPSETLHDYDQRRQTPWDIERKKSERDKP
jgi:hypothetical protein